jgi:polysaccharide biosynthesis/export protein
VIQARLGPGGKGLKEVVEGLSVDVLAYNSRAYYVIKDNGDSGQAVCRFPLAGRETVLDAIANMQGLPPVASKCRIWVARSSPGHDDNPRILLVDWKGITQRGEMRTDYALQPGDRVFVMPWPSEAPRFAVYGADHCAGLGEAIDAALSLAGGLFPR